MVKAVVRRVKCVCQFSVGSEAGSCGGKSVCWISVSSEGCSLLSEVCLFSVSSEGCKSWSGVCILVQCEQ